jgi:cardiolipin synthase
MALPQFVPGNRLTLLCNGEHYFPALIEAIDAARTELFLETYIFADDETGSLVAQALARAASRGVAVRLLLDGFGAHDFAPRFRDMLESAGAQILVFRPNISPWTLRRNRLRRMHRKVAVVDASCAFVGGINVIDDYDTPGHTPPRYDYAVRIEGPLTLRVRDAAATLWSRVAWADFRRRWVAPPPPGIERASPGRQEALAALVIRDNVAHRRDIEDAYLGMIEAAQDEIVIANAYFFPGRRFRQALVSAAARGVRVVLLLQGRVEYVLMHYASRALYGSLLDGGVEIHEYHKSFLHAKVAVVDGRWASVGSSNIDPFSLLLAREANLFVDDAAFAGELRRSLHGAIDAGARQIPQQHWKRLPVLQRVRIWLAYGLARLMLALAGTEGWH